MRTALLPRLAATAVALASVCAVASDAAAQVTAPPVQPTTPPAPAPVAQARPSAYPEVRWNHDWPRFSLAEALISAAVTLRDGDLGKALDGPTSATIKFEVPILDHGARGLLRAGSDRAAGADRLRGAHHRRHDPAARLARPRPGSALRERVPPRGLLGRPLPELSQRARDGELHRCRPSLRAAQVPAALRWRRARHGRVRVGVTKSNGATAFTWMPTLTGTSDSGALGLLGTF